MAINSAVVMPLERCCMEKISKRSVLDRENDVMWCKECGEYLAFHNGAWKSFDQIDDHEWYDYDSGKWRL